MKPKIRKYALGSAYLIAFAVAGLYALLLLKYHHYHAAYARNNYAIEDGAARIAESVLNNRYLPIYPVSENLMEKMLIASRGELHCDRALTDVSYDQKKFILQVYTLIYNQWKRQEGSIAYFAVEHSNNYLGCGMSGAKYSWLRLYAAENNRRLEKVAVIPDKKGGSYCDIYKVE